MAKVRTTLTIDEDVLKWVKIRAARTGVSDSAVIEESLRRDLKLDVLDELWSKATLSEARASELALEAQHATRPRRQAKGGLYSVTPGGRSASRGSAFSEGFRVCSAG